MKLNLSNEDKNQLNENIVLLKYQFYPIKSEIDTYSKFMVLLDGTLQCQDDVIKGPITFIQGPWIALTECHVLFFKKDNKAENEHINFFLSLPVFYNWSQTSMQKIVAKAEVVSYQRNDMVYTVGNIPEYIYIVKVGEYEILRHYTGKNKKKLYLENLIGPPHERKKRKEFCDKHLFDRKNIGSNFTIEESVLLVL